MDPDTMFKCDEIMSCLLSLLSMLIILIFLKQFRDTLLIYVLLHLSDKPTLGFFSLLG